ncbi:MAG: hypothetical protein REI11_00705, partial [Patulibacter sp.]|nr:hypothetical protein [Patulibacter sp.]
RWLTHGIVFSPEGVRLSANMRTVEFRPSQIARIGAGPVGCKQLCVYLHDGAHWTIPGFWIAQTTFWQGVRVKHGHGRARPVVGIDGAPLRCTPATADMVGAFLMERLHAVCVVPEPALSTVTEADPSSAAVPDPAPGVADGPAPTDTAEPGSLAVVTRSASTEVLPTLSGPVAQGSEVQLRSEHHARGLARPIAVLGGLWAVYLVGVFVSAFSPAFADMSDRGLTMVGEGLLVGAFLTFVFGRRAIVRFLVGRGASTLIGPEGLRLRDADRPRHLFPRDIVGFDAVPSEVTGLRLGSLRLTTRRIVEIRVWTTDGVGWFLPGLDRSDVGGRRTGIQARGPHGAAWAPLVDSEGHEVVWVGDHDEAFLQLLMNTVATPDTAPA